MAVNLGTAIGYLDLDISRYARGIDSAIAQTGKLSTAAGTATTAVEKIASAMTTAGTIMTVGITAPVIGFTAASVKAGAKFDSAMSKVKAVSYTTMDDITGLEDAAKNLGVKFVDTGDNVQTSFNTIRNAAIKMGNDTKFTADESADALYYMGLAGWNSAEMLNGLKGILDLSAASGVDLAQTSDIVTDALTAFGKEASYSTSFANALAAASANSNTNVDLLGESFKYVGSVAGGYGYSIQDVTLALGLMASAGVKGTQAGTSLRQALKQLTDPSDENAKLMEKYGITLADSTGKMYSLREVMGQWRESFAGLNVDLYDTAGNLKTGEQILEEYGHSLPTSEFEKLNAVANIFGTRALPGVLAIINSGEGDFNMLADAIDNADSSFGGLGEAAGQAQMRMDNLSGDWVRFTSAIGTTKVIISDMINGPLRGLVQFLTKLVTTFNNMSPAQQEFIVKAIAIGAAIGPVLLLLGKILPVLNTLNTMFGITSGVAGALSSVMSGLGSVFAFLLSPIGLITAGIVLLAGYIIYLWHTNEDFRNNVIAAWEYIKTSVVTTATNIMTGLGQIWDAIVTAVMGAVNSVVNFFTVTLPTGISNGVNTAISNVNQFISNVRTAFTEGVSAAGQKINEFKQMCSDRFEAAKQTVTQKASAIKENFLSRMDGMKSGASKTLNDIKGWFKSDFDRLKNEVTTKSNNIKTNFTNALNGMKSGAQNALNSIGNWFTSKMNSIRTTVQNGVNKLKSAFNFSWSLPKIKLPHFSVSGNFSLNPPSIPHFGISWYAKAMRDGMIMNEPTIFGWDSKTGRFLAGGESGSEVVVGTKSLLEMIKEAVHSSMSELSTIVGGYCATVVDSFVSVNSVLGDIIETFSNVTDGFAKEISTVEKVASAMKKLDKDVDSGYGRTRNNDFSVSDDMLNRLAAILIEILRNAPINYNTTFEVRQGDVVLDKERTGRALAPVISRIQATT